MSTVLYESKSSTITGVNDYLKEQAKLANLRPNVKKHLAAFQGYVTTYGADTVRGCLKSKTGKFGKARIAFVLSDKDKFQLLQVLGLTVKPSPFGKTLNCRCASVPVKQ